MLNQKKKFSRKEIKEDKLVTTYYKILAFYDENKSKIALYGGILAAAVFMAVMYLNSRNADNETAAVELARITPFYDQGLYQEAIDGLQAGLKSPQSAIGLKRIVEEYGSSRQGEIAKIYLANSYYFLGNFDEAKKYYEDYSGGVDVFKAAAYAGIAACYEAKEDFSSAAKYYLKAAEVSDNNPLTHEYYAKAGVCFYYAKNNDNAVKYLKKTKTDFPTSSSAREAEKYLAILGE